ncbi:hypothetical protein CRG98_045869 [Punica granatum]|uniref:Major facilitator superfamily (MFS) profile domain-containing protein n=1 Tax=Punica granatum TaxID=22663 RepID=A0A2I0HPV4_PUNGR|nr:hypothetical protein CRG98_045869 [Punica granatum]
MAPHKHRGALSIGFQLSITIGILLGNLLSHFFAKLKGESGWRLSLGGAIFPSLITIFGGLLLPDTPTSLIEQGHVPEAKQVLERICCTHEVDEEFSRLVARVIGLVELNAVAKLDLMLIKWYAIVEVLFICIYVAGFAWSWGPKVWRVHLCRLRFGVFIFFRSFELIMSGFMYYFLPETKGIPIDEMDKVWKIHWYWSRFISRDDFPITGPERGRPSTL